MTADPAAVVGLLRDGIQASDGRRSRLETTRVYARPTAEDRGKAVDLLPVDD